LLVEDQGQAVPRRDGAHLVSRQRCRRRRVPHRQTLAGLLVEDQGQAVPRRDGAHLVHMKRTVSF
ncbi:MAG: hypothetical protein ACREJ5_22705, partial [Geminicoccaceae bacterium]